MGKEAVSGITFAGDLGHNPGSVFADFGRKNRGQTALERGVSQLQVTCEPPQGEAAKANPPPCPTSTRHGQRQIFSLCFPRKTKGVAAPAIPNS
ncbi:MAG: hypothetical protein ABSG52_06090 [Terriglobales bacterium]|jgi:hypothetical protein